jgi:hypothetical protein
VCTRCGVKCNHEWNGCQCTCCKQTRDEEHQWEIEDIKYYGGNDINGWGPGGETTTTYRCGRCGKIYTTAIYDDDD